MVEQTLEVTVYYTVQEDGSHLAASVNAPRFAIAAESFEEAKAKVDAVLSFHCRRMADEFRPLAVPNLAQKTTRAVRPFAPSYIERRGAPAHCEAA